MKDAKGQVTPSWVRYVDKVAASGSLAEQKKGDGTTIPFGIYCSEDATVTLTTIDDSASLEIVLIAGYHPIECKSITTTDVAIYALFPYKP